MIFSPSINRADTRSLLLVTQDGYFHLLELYGPGYAPELFEKVSIYVIKFTSPKHRNDKAEDADGKKSFEGEQGKEGEQRAKAYDNGFFHHDVSKLRFICLGKRHRHRPRLRTTKRAPVT